MIVAALFVAVLFVAVVYGSMSGVGVGETGLTEKEICISRSLANVLRHKAHDWGIEIDDLGWVTLSALKKFSPQGGVNKAGRRTAKNLDGIDEETLRRIAKRDEKGRFETREEGPFAIRACQGHSMSGLNVGLKEISESQMDGLKVLHGTTRKAWVEISTKGLSRMGRQYIHFASGLPGEVKSGMRLNSSVVIEVDPVQVRTLGGKFFRSSNGVILCAGIPDGEGGYDHIPPKCFRTVIDAKTQVPLEY